MALFGIDIDLLDEDSNLGAAIAATFLLLLHFIQQGVLLLLLAQALQTYACYPWNIFCN